MHKSTFDGAANRVIAELVERSNEVIYFPLKKEQAFLESRNVRWAVCHRRYSMQMRCEGEKKRLLLPKGVCLHQCANTCDWNKNLVHVDSNYTRKTQDNDMFMGSPLQRLLEGPNPSRAGNYILVEGYANCGSIMRL